MSIVLKHCKAAPDVSADEEDKDPFAGLNQDLSERVLLMMIQRGGEQNYEMGFAMEHIYR